MTTSTDLPGPAAASLGAAERKMRAAGLPEAAVTAFRGLFAQLAAGGPAGLLPTDTLGPVERVPSLDELDPAEAPLDELAIVKLNGGLGTSMGLSLPKSLVEVRPGLTFLDVIARQVLAARERHGARLPLVLMHSFATRERSLAHLAR